jgi:hypothetical protein
MILVEDIQKKIHSMGYLAIKNLKVNPSYYELNDGTIIEAIVRIDSIIQDSSQPNGFFIRSSNVVKAYVPKDKRDPKKFIPYSLNELITGIIEEDLPSEELSSDYSEYELSNNVILNIRSIVSQIKKQNTFLKMENQFIL